MRSGVGEWLATCVGSPICILLLSWTLLIYQNQPSCSKRRIDLLVVAVLSQSLVHQLGLLLYAILTLIGPANHFGEVCSTLVWVLNSSSILQELSLTTIAIFAAISSDEVTKNHLKYHILSMSILSACIGVTGVLNFEPDRCVFVAHELSPKYGIFFNSLRGLLVLTSILSLFVTFYKDIFTKPKNELLKSVSDLSELSSKNSSGFECHQDRTWDPSSVSCTSSSTNSRACLRKKKVVDENNSHSTVYSVLFICYICNHIPVLVTSIRPELLRGFCTPQNIATWLPLLQDLLLPIFLAIFDKMFCHYVAKVYTKQDHASKLSHGGIDGKFRHFEQDAEYKLQLNLNHGLKFPLTNGSLYGRLHNHQNRGRNGTITMGIQHYPRSPSHEENAYSSLPAELTSFASSTFEPRQESRIAGSHIAGGKATKEQNKVDRIRINENFEFGNKRKIGSTDVFGQNMENLVQIEDGATMVNRSVVGSGQGIMGLGMAASRSHYIKGSLSQICEEGPRIHVPKVVIGLENCSRLEKSLEGKLKYNSCTEIHEIPSARGRKLMRRNQSFDESTGNVARLEGDSRTYVKGKRYPSVFELNYGVIEATGANYDTSDDESCDLDVDFRDFGDTISSCRSCCSVTTVANDDFEFFQRQEPRAPESTTSKKTFVNSEANMRSFTPKIIDKGSKSSKAAVCHSGRDPGKLTKPTIQSYHLKNKMASGYSMNDLDKLTVNNKGLALSVESLRIILKDSTISYMDNGELCRHDMGGSAPDFKKIFVSEFI